MNIRQKLLWFLTAGVTETIGESPINRLSKKGAVSLSVVSPSSESTTGQSPSASSYMQTSDKAGLSDTFLTQARQAAAVADSLPDLYARRQEFEGCPLKKTAVHTINGRGKSQNPTLLCLIETPDASDDKTGRLFSGEAGALLDKMLSAIDLSTDKDVYLSALCPWRAPGNRRLSDAEATLCRPFWEKEIALIQPSVILTLGIGAAAQVLHIESLGKARSAQHDYQGIPVFSILAPSTVIKQPAQRRPTWEDLKKLKAFLNNS